MPIPQADKQNLPYTVKLVALTVYSIATYHYWLDMAQISIPKYVLYNIYSAIKVKKEIDGFWVLVMVWWPRFELGRKHTVRFMLGRVSRLE